MKSGIKIIGLSGTNGSGKDLIGDILTKKHGYLFISGSDILREECRKRGLPVIRENLSAISAEWRRQGGAASLIDKVVEGKFKPVQSKYFGLVIGSLRHPGEAERVHELGGGSYMGRR